MTKHPDTYTVESGRRIYRNGMPCIEICRDGIHSGMPLLTPTEADTLTHKLCALLNTDAARDVRHD